MPRGARRGLGGTGTLAFRAWFSVTWGEGVVEKDRGALTKAAAAVLEAIEGMAGRRASVGIRYRSIGAAMMVVLVLSRKLLLGDCLSHAFVR